jgi:CRISPR/Cas system-associated exonuclease Cas4 (RecB family)
MWIIIRNAVSGEQRDSIQNIKHRFRSDGMGELCQLNCVYNHLCRVKSIIMND